MTSPSIVPEQDSRAKLAREAFAKTVARGKLAASALKVALADATNAMNRFGRAARKVGDLDADS